MFEFSKLTKEFIKKELSRYEDKNSAIIPCLFKAQEELGWVSPEVIDALSKEMAIPTSRISEVAQFYTMFNKAPVGKYHIQVCCNISCSMAGGRELTEHMLKKLNVRDGEVTADGRFSVSRVECLGSCGTAPMMQVNDLYYENLDNAVVDRLIQSEFK